jgi:hypothetical protein
VVAVLGVVERHCCGLRLLLEGSRRREAEREGETSEAEREGGWFDLI